MDLKPKLPIVAVLIIALVATGFILYRVNNPDAAFDSGNYYFGGGAYDLNKAEKYYKKTLELDSNYAGANYQIARIYFIRGQFNMALTYINKEIELYPDFKRSLYVRGLIYGYSSRLAEAEEDFKDFLRWKPESWAGHNDLAWVYFQEGKYEEARDTALAGLVIMPNNPWLLNSLGVALLNLGDKDGAKQAFNGALKIVGSMNENSWGAAYPGNDPAIYEGGYAKMKESMEANLKLL
jgi:tetratricopeptide (TPR) repeat protein